MREDRVGEPRGVAANSTPTWEAVRWRYNGGPTRATGRFSHGDLPLQQKLDHSKRSCPDSRPGRPGGPQPCQGRRRRRGCRDRGCDWRCRRPHRHGRRCRHRGCGGRGSRERYGRSRESQAGRQVARVALHPGSALFCGGNRCSTAKAQGRIDAQVEGRVDGFGSTSRKRSRPGTAPAKPFPAVANFEDVRARRPAS
jgi:hypothetical protein